LAAQNDNTDFQRLLRAPVLGRTPQLVAEDVSVQVSFSPDAKRIVYGNRNSPEAGKSQILIADATGRNEKVLATIPQAWFEHFCGWKNDKYGREKNPPQFLPFPCR
jgi:hypothetical protein